MSEEISCQKILSGGHSGAGCTFYSMAHYCPRKARLAQEKIGTEMPVPDKEKVNSLVLGSLTHAMFEHYGDNP